ncbi:ATP-dependent DNA helicase [Populus alba x Populus x berolinensis]|nr:ATP-dependent DNA helicase [Populus alba x Populus x berolinensis]
MTSPHEHVQPDEYVPSSPYSQFVLNDYETPVDRILLSDNPSSSNTPSAPQHTQGVGTLVCSRQHIDIQTTFSLSSNIVQTESNEINAARLSNPTQSTALASFHCDESEELSEQTLNHQSTISQASYQKKKAYVIQSCTFCSHLTFIYDCLFYIICSTLFTLFFTGYLIEYIDFGDKSYKCNHCNALFWLQERLARSAKTNPCFTLCCNNGKVVLPAPQETPNYLDNLLNPNNGSSSKKFRREIRAYNSMFAFTSMGAVVDHSVNSRPGSYVFKVNGYCHHLMGSLLPMDNRGPKFAQLYIFDTDNEVSNRLQPFCNENFQSSLDSQIVVGLINMLDSSNQLVRLFRHAGQRFADVEVPEFKLRLIGKRDDDSRQYDDPSLNDIGGLVVGDIGHCRSDRDIIIESLSGTLQRISKLHPKFMSLHYPLLFPYGEDGFHTDIPLAHQEQQPPKKRQKVSMRAYYAYLIHEREKQESTLIKGGRLYQQFLVDAFVNVEEERLDFIRANQENLRNEHYKGIHDVVTRGDIDGSTTGKIILPSSLTGSPRYMANNYQDAMAICRCYGNPDLFITFTCNVNWPEIRREIKKTRSYQPEDKPDIIARVFHSKLIDMMSFIKSGKPFGRTIAGISISFLKFQVCIFILLQTSIFTSLLAFSLFRCLRCGVPKKRFATYSFVSLASSRIQIPFA